MKYMFFSLVLAALCITQNAHASLRTQIPDTNIIDFTADGGRVLDLNDNESISVESFINLVHNYKAIDMPLIVIRVNKGQNEQYYDWQSFANLPNPDTDPLTNTKVVSRDFYTIELIDEKLFLTHLGSITQVQQNVPLVQLINSLTALYKAYIELAKSNLATAHAFDSLDNFNSAIPFYQAALNSQQLPPDKSALTQTHLAFCYLRTQKFEKAILLYHAALESQQLNSIDRAITQTNLGACYRLTQKYNDAISHYEAALNSQQLPPDTSLTTQAFLAFCYTNTEKFEKAIGYCNIILESNQLAHEDILLVESCLANCYLATNQYENAIPHCKKALDSDKKFQWTKALDSNNFQMIHVAIMQTHLARCYKNTHRFEEAIQYYTIALESKDYLVGGEIALLNLELAQCHKDAQNYSIAIEFYKKALDSRIYFKEKDISSAQADLEYCESQLREKRTEHPTEASSSAKAHHPNSGQ